MKGRPSRVAGVLLGVLSFVVAAPARAQSPATPSLASSADDVPSFGELFTRTLRDFQQLPSLGNLEWLGIGGIAAIAAHPADEATTHALDDSGALHDSFGAGAFVGGTPFELGAAFAAYGIGRAFNKLRVAQVAADLVQAELIAESLTFGLKEVARRARPSGSGFSFPSGHTTVTFASATVLQRHFGWRVGVPAYVVAMYVGTSRIQDKHHYLSDVAFGAALGIVAGRTVTVSRRHRLGLGVAPALGGGAVLFSIRQ